MLLVTAVTTTASASWITAAIGLVGVFVGGLLTAGLQVLHDRRVERRDAKVAARVLRSQLNAVVSSLTIAINTKYWGSFSTTDLTGWSDYQPALAASLSPNEYDTVRQAEVGVRQLLEPLIRKLSAKGSDGLIAVPLNDEDNAKIFVIALHLCREAYSSLHRISQEPASAMELPLGDEPARGFVERMKAANAADRMEA